RRMTRSSRSPHCSPPAQNNSARERFRGGGSGVQRQCIWIRYNDDMSTSQLRQRAKKKLDQVPADDLQSAMAFIDYLADRAHGLVRPPLEERLKQAARDLRAGKAVPWDQLRRKYRRV